MMLYFITSTAMLIHFIMFVYYIYLANSFPQTVSDRQIYYTTAIIPLAPITIYGFNMANYIWNEYPIDAAFLHAFFIEWCFTNPLFITNLARVINIKSAEQLILTALILFMIIFGYLSHIAHTYSEKIVLYIIGAVSFGIINAYLILKYKRQKRIAHPQLIGKLRHNYFSIYKTILITILGTWSIYPIVFMIYTSGYISHEDCAIAFVCLDFVSKAIFTGLLIGYHENKHRRNSVISYIARKASRILPIETDDIASNYYDTVGSNSTIILSRPTTAMSVQTNQPANDVI